MECSTGVLLQSHSDFFLPGPIPIQFTRSYRSLDGPVNTWYPTELSSTREFGFGQTDNYDIFLIGISGINYYLVLPDGAQVSYQPISDNLWQSLTNSGIFTGSTLTLANPDGPWLLTLKNGTVLTFPDSYGVTNSLLRRPPPDPGSLRQHSLDHSEC